MKEQLTLPGTYDELLAGVACLQIRKTHPWPMRYQSREGSTLHFVPVNAEGVVASIHDYDLLKLIDRGSAKIIVYLSQNRD